MPLVSEQMPNLMNGVSQQALSMRLPSQAEVQVNGYSSIVEGTNKRLPTKHIAKIVDGQAGETYTHLINRDTSERYVVMVFDGSIKVFDLDGTERTVTYPDGTGYITGLSPESDVRALTIADNTFIVNKERVVDTLPDLTPETPAHALLFVRSVNYDVTYTVRVDGQDVIVYTTDDAYGDAPDAFSVPAPVDTTEGTDEAIPTDFLPGYPQEIKEQAWDAQQLDAATADKPKVSVDEVTEKIAAVLAAELHPDYTVEVYSPVISVKRNDGTPFDIEFTDSSGGIHTRVVPGKIQRFSELPVVAPHGYVVKVYGDDVSNVDDYFLRFDANNGGPGMDAGVWVETVGPGIEYRLDPATMPHTLIRQPDGNFTLEQVEWGEREAGDTETAPWPSFVGAKISDVFLATNRMCFLSGSNVVMSRTNALFSFFPETVATLLDDGPIDVSASGTSVADLKYAIPYKKEILLFSGQTQYSVDAKTLLASEPPEVKRTTSYEIDDGSAPVAIGNTVFFASRRKQYTSVMEYAVIPETETTDASDLTKHVPTYIPAGTSKMFGSAQTETMLLLSEGARDKLYAYKYYWRGEQKLQSSWSVWQFQADCSIISGGVVNDTAYLVVQYQDGVYLESVDIGDGFTEDDGRFVLRLDRRIDQTQVSVAYSAETGLSTLTLPYELDAAPVVVFSPLEENYTPYTLPVTVSASGDTVVVKGDMSSSLFYVGVPYSFQYEFSKPVLKTAVASGGQASVIAGRLQLNKFHLSYADTGYFEVEVETGNGQTYTYTFTGQILGTTSATLGELNVSDGVFSFRVNANARNARITVKNDSFLPNALTGAEWEGRYERRTSSL